MIKGYYLPNVPKMDKVSETDILKELDPHWMEVSDSTTGIEYSMGERNFLTENYRIIHYSVDKAGYLGTVYSIYKIIEKACPELIKIIPYGDCGFFVAHDGSEEVDGSYTLLLDELTRIITLFQRATGYSDKEIVDYIKEYLNFAVAWPGKTNVNIHTLKDSGNGKTGKN